MTPLVIDFPELAGFVMRLGVAVLIVSLGGYLLEATVSIALTFIESTTGYDYERVDWPGQVADLFWRFGALLCVIACILLMSSPQLKF